MAIFDPRYMSGVEAALAKTSKAGQQSGAASARAARGAGESILNKDLQETLDLFKKQLATDAEKIAAGQKPFFKSPEEAAAYWDKVYQQISTGATKGIYSIGPNAPRITYKKDGQLFELNRDVKPPAGAERVSLTDADILEMMPPRPQVTPKPAGEPNAYGAPPPPGYGAAPPPPPPGAGPAAAGPAAATPAQEAVQVAKETMAPRGRSEGPWGQRPPAYSGFGSKGAPETVQAAREAIATPRPTPQVEQGPWGARPNPAPSMTPIIPRQRYTPREVPLADVLAVPAALGAGAVGTGVMYGYDPKGTEKMLRNAFNTITGSTDVVPTERSEDHMINPPVLPHMGPGVSHDASDFVSDNVPNRYRGPGVSYDTSDFAPNSDTNQDMTPPAPDYSGRELGPQAAWMQGNEQRFPPMSRALQIEQPNEPRRFPATSTAHQIIQRAQAVQAQRQAAEDVLKQSPNQLVVSKSDNPFKAAWSDGIQGGSYGAPDDRYVAAFANAYEREKQKNQNELARGGTAKKSNKDDVLHKALEIIHHMLTRR